MSDEIHDEEERDLIEVTDENMHHTPLWMTAPEHCWLAVGDEPEDWQHEFHDCIDVTWADGGFCPVSVGVEYVRADLYDSLRAELAELRARVPAICFPRQPNGEGGWVIDANYVAAIHKDCFPIEWQPCEEEVEAVLLAVERAAPVTPAAVPDDVAKGADPEYAWSLCGEEYHDRLDTREAAIAELDGSGGFTGRVVDAYDACGECDIAEVIVDQVEKWLYDSVPSDDFIIDVTEEQKDALNSIVWEWFYKNVSPNRWTVTDVHQHEAAILAAKENKP